MLPRVREVAVVAKNYSFFILVLHFIFHKNSLRCTSPTFTKLQFHNNYSFDHVPPLPVYETNIIQLKKMHQYIGAKAA